MAEAVFERAMPLADQPLELGEHSVGIVGMQTLDPELLIVAHLPRRVGHDRVQVLADEGAGIVARHLRGVDDGGARADQRLEVVHHGHAFAERLLRLFAIGDVGPRADDLGRAPLRVADHPERVLDPDVMAVAMAEAIFDRPSAFLDQRSHLLEYALGVLRMQPHRPEILVLEHLPGREAHDARDVLADEGAGVVARLVGVDDGRRDRHQIAQPLARRLQFGGALLNALLQLVMRLAELFLLTLARAEIGGEADHAGFLAVLVEQDRG